MKFGKKSTAVLATTMPARTVRVTVRAVSK